MARGLDVDQELRRQAAFVEEVGDWLAPAGPGQQEGSGARGGRPSPGRGGGLELAGAEGANQPEFDRGEEAVLGEEAALEAVQGEEVNLRWVDWVVVMGLQLIRIFFAVWEVMLHLSGVTAAGGARAGHLSGVTAAWVARGPGQVRWTSAWRSWRSCWCPNLVSSGLLPCLS